MKTTVTQHSQAEKFNIHTNRKSNLMFSIKFKVVDNLKFNMLVRKQMSSSPTEVADNTYKCAGYWLLINCQYRY